MNTAKESGIRRWVAAAPYGLVPPHRVSLSSCVRGDRPRSGRAH